MQDLRGVAVMLVVLVHATGLALIRQSRGLDHSGGFFAAHRSIGQFGASGVDLFFVISGFVMALLLTAPRRPSRSEFLYKRFIRIVPLFWLASLLFIALNFAAGRHVDQRALLTSVTILPTRIFHYDWPTLFVGWSLGYELIFYAVVAFALHQSRPRVVAAASMATLALASVQHPPPPGLLAIMSNAIQLEFVWGMAVFAAWRAMSGRLYAAALGAALFLTGSALLLPQLFHSAFGSGYLLIVSSDTSVQRAFFWGLPWALVTLGLLLCCPQEKAAGRAHAALRLTGEASYSIYLTHLSVTFLAETLLPRNAIPEDALVATILVLALAAGIAAHLCVERPLLRILERTGPAKWRQLASAPAPVPSRASRPQTAGRSRTVARPGG